MTANAIDLKLSYNGLIPQAGENFGHGMALHAGYRLIDAGSLSISIGGELSVLHQSRTPNDAIDPCPDRISPEGFCGGDVEGSLSDQPVEGLLYEPASFKRFAARPTMTMSYQMLPFLNVQGSVGVGPELLLKREPYTIDNLEEGVETTFSIQWITVKLGGSLMLTLPHIDLAIGGGIMTGAKLANGEANNVPHLFVESGAAVHF